MKLDDIKEMIEDFLHFCFGKLDAFGDGAPLKHDFLPQPRRRRGPLDAG
jgi:hypothetical protein